MPNRGRYRIDIRIVRQNRATDGRNSIGRKCRTKDLQIVTIIVNHTIYISIICNKQGLCNDSRRFPKFDSSTFLIGMIGVIMSGPVTAGTISTVADLQANGGVTLDSAGDIYAADFGPFGAGQGPRRGSTRSGTDLDGSGRDGA